jgi:beta-N-acetylhexosaminidase
MMKDFEDIGNRFLVGLRPGISLHPQDRKLLEDLRPTGVILFKENFDQECDYTSFVAQVGTLVQSVREAIGRPRIFVCIDHEGGRVFRLPQPFTNFGPARIWARFSEEVGAAYGAELSSLGINLNFSPVLDVDSNPANPVIGDRAFGTTQTAVASAAIAFIVGQNSAGVRTCGKHFPGHGDTEADSHYSLPIVNINESALRERELPPFQAAINSDVGMIMSAHMMLPAIDSTAPTTASQVIGRGLLRGALGFDGVYTTDDLGMHAVQAMLDEPGFAVRVANAGHDLFMMCSAWTSTDRLYDFAAQIERGLKSQQIDRAEWARSLERINALLARTPQPVPRVCEPVVFEKHRNLSRRIAAARS